MIELVFLLAAGFFGGVLNTIAGGGSFITFPALLAVGVPPISANATNTFASFAGYASGTYGFRQELTAHKHELIKLVVVSIVGGVLGAWLLLQTSETSFQNAIPWLLLLATILFVYGGRFNSYLKQQSLGRQHSQKVGASLLLLALLGVCVYGGFFNAGLGIITLSYLALAGFTNINVMNGMKLLISTVVSLVAIALFIFEGKIAWVEGMAVLVGALVGGYAAAYVSKRLSQRGIRRFVIAVSCMITLYFFVEIYYLN